jgi:phosphoglycolate phosphatase-like HAD superfamily hydrolase
LIRILSDFDGVWTDHQAEAEEVRRFQAELAAELAGVSAAEARADFASYVRAVLEQPERHGWSPDGRISAFVDEDPFCQASSIAGWLEARSASDARAALYCQAVRAAGHASMNAFADHCFLEATQAFRSRRAPAMVDGALAAADALAAAGAELVVASNSRAEKVVDWLSHAGIDAGVGPGHLVRVHGDAGKWRLAGDAAIEVGGRRVLVDRPLYRAVIEEEDPDIVIGDVFSLDLALPSVLRAAGHPKAPDLIALRRHAHTPAWVLETMGGGGIDLVVEHVRDLVEVVHELNAQQ